MSKILGLDLGTNSVGWAIRDTNNNDNQIIDFGVLTFEKGVATEKGNEFPKVQKRTESRGKRRNYQAEKYRKWKLLEYLIEKQMCPLSLDELDLWRKYTKGKKRIYPQSSEFINWLRFDFDGDGKPDFHLINKTKHDSYYAFRALAIDPDFTYVFDNNPYLLGRIFYQLVQKRGFRGRDEEEAKTILVGNEKTGTAGRDAIAMYIEKHKTLGAALYHYQKENGGRIRQRYNLRKDYEDELKKLCDIHKISTDDHQKLWKAIIWQRPLRSQKGLIGTCVYEKNKKRAPISHPLYEEFRTWIFINNLKIQPPAGLDLSTYLKSKIYPIFYKSSNDFDLKPILTQIKKDGASIQSKFSENTKVISAKLLKSFLDILGNDWEEKYRWNDIHQREKQPEKKTETSYTTDDIWHILNTFDDREKLKQFAIDKLMLDDEKADKFSRIKLNQGYATLSLSAIKKILPFLQKGFLYSQAVYLANLYKVVGADSLSDNLINFFASEIDKIIYSNHQEKTNISIVNNLIQDDLNENYRYTIETERDLDEDEKQKVLLKTIDVYGEKTWNELNNEQRQFTLRFVEENYKSFLKKSNTTTHQLFIQPPRLHDQIFSMLKENYDIPETKKKYLWHPSEQEMYSPATEYRHFIITDKHLFIPHHRLESFKIKHPEAEYQGRDLKLLGSPEPVSKGLKNPMALKALHKLKHLINYLLETDKIDENTRIVIEIARELNDANKRKAIEKWNKERENENESYKKIIREINEGCQTTFDENDKTLLKKIRLWEEQGRRCIYTGKTINCNDVFNGSKFDLEHTIPASISFDNELKNLTLADTDFNRNIKGKLFPTQLSNYEEIKVRLKFMEDKVAHFENLYKEWRNKSSYASTKEIKDNCIQRAHMLKMDLDYWRSKLHTFTLEEYKAGWKNSQLRDTQIITKYALPYLKTVFKKVSVEKAEIIHVFKEIYEVKLPHDKKNRNVHSHHAIDAAILTLIPSFHERDAILLKYNEEKDRKTGKIYHQKPKDWSSFTATKILELENKILINNLTENKTTLPTYKAIRKKGKIVWTDKEKGIKKMAQGDTIRGQLHGESLFGAIKLPKRNNDRQILFDENKKMILDEEPRLVIRKELCYKINAQSPGFKSLDEIKKVIIDKDLFEMIRKQVDLAPDFKTAMTNGIYMLDKQGNKVNRIRRIRCEETMKFATAIKVHPHMYKSEKVYKQYTLAKNGENALCLFYKSELEKSIEILTIGKLAKLKFDSDEAYFAEPYFKQKELGKGKKKTTVQLYAILRTGQKVLFYQKNIDELRELQNEGRTDELSARMFKIYQFETDGRIKFRHHLAAGIDSELKQIHPEFSAFDKSKQQIFLRLRQANWNFAIEGKDFTMKLDGSIEFETTHF